MSPVRTRRWDGTQLLGGNGELPGWSDPWVGGTMIGTLEPIGQGEIGAFGQTTRNVGAGLFEDRAFPTAELVVQTGVTYNATSKRFTISVPIHDRVIRGFVTLTETGELWNCHVAGPTAEYTSGYTAMVEGPATTGTGRIYWTTIAPIVASAYYDGIGRGIDYWYCDIYDVVDGVRGMSNSVNGARIHGHASDLHHSAQFRPDYANGSGRPETHNDTGGQGQGNLNGDDNDISYDGCRINARHSLTKGTGSPTRTQIAALMLTPQNESLGAVHMRFDDGWLYGGIYCVNAGGDNLGDYGGSSLTIRRTRFERPGTDMFGDGRAPDRALAVDSSLTLVHSGNTYIDNGAPVVPISS